MLDQVYEFFGLAGLETPPSCLAELIPYLLQFTVAIVLVLATFKLVAAVLKCFFSWGWLK